MSEPATDSREGLFCPHCDYSLRGTAGNACPECGEAFDPKELSESRIPWVHRREIGRFRGYWRTVMMVVFDFHRFCHEVNKPVSFADAKQFHRVTAGIVFLAELILFAMLLRLFVDDLPWVGRLVRMIWPVLVVVFCMVLYALTVTELHTIWFCPRSMVIERRNHTVALSYYGAGPMALSPLIALSALATDFVPQFSIVTIVLITLIGLTCWAVLVYLVLKTARRSAVEVVLFAITWPVSCAAMAGVTLALIPMCAWHIAVILVNWG